MADDVNWNHANNAAAVELPGCLAASSSILVGLSVCLSDRGRTGSGQARAGRAVPWRARSLTTLDSQTGRCCGSSPRPGPAKTRSLLVDSEAPTVTDTVRAQPARSLSVALLRSSAACRGSCVVALVSCQIRSNSSSSVPDLQ